MGVIRARMTKMLPIAIVVALTGPARAGGPMFARPAATEPTPVLRAGLHDDPPFSIKKGDQWSGIAVDLLRPAARRRRRRDARRFRANERALRADPRVLLEQPRDRAARAEEGIDAV